MDVLRGIMRVSEGVRGFKVGFMGLKDVARVLSGFAGYQVVFGAFQEVSETFQRVLEGSRGVSVNHKGF